METYKYQGNQLAYKVIYPDNYSPKIEYPMIVLLHGYANRIESVARLAPEIDTQGYIYLCPGAPISFNLRGSTVYAWMPPFHPNTPRRGPGS